ncbi:MAG: ABC transporter ATP-binding protein [Spirochaetaceae bacterium]|nr:ABC transporter ATP-binding protein [Spirochaetaceae bacterium]
MSDALLRVSDLRTYFHTDDGVVRAVDGVSFSVAPNQTLGVVGESGCGKSVTALSVLRLVKSPPGKLESGSMMLATDGGSVDLAKLPQRGRRIRAIRGRDVSMIFQEPMRALTPVYTIGFQIKEALQEHTGMGADEVTSTAVEMLRAVGMPDPEQRMNTYPHQLSGGMRQRGMIAMALVCRPKLLIADEPTTALDVTIEAQILALLKRLQEQFHMAILFITHDLGVIAKMADDVMVMYLGQVMERARVRDLFHDPRHPYTQALFRSIPSMVEEPKQRLAVIQGSVPHPLTHSAGCPFAPRCDHASDRCAQKPPEFEVGRDHTVACWLHEGKSEE